ncbi:MAG: ABC transporter ATP-binding protein [Gammaproteobacteria bacterium]|nr:ABC transporter ATP-binding protein [Gammaproteobacteria bacterium]
MIEFKQVGKIYGENDNRVVALKTINLAIHHGEMVAIIGPSGSGKSTLLNLLGLLDRPNEGEYYLDGIPVSQCNDNQLAHHRNYKIGFVFQSFLLIPKLTVMQNIMLPLLYRNLSVRKARQEAEKLLNKFAILDLQKKRPNQLSGGQKQRVALCRALITNPQVILADEPTGALDSKNSDVVMAEFAALHQQKQAKTLIIVTHDPTVAERCQRIITVRDGTITDDRQSKETSCA